MKAKSEAIGSKVTCLALPRADGDFLVRRSFHESKSSELCGLPRTHQTPQLDAAHKQCEMSISYC